MNAIVVRWISYKERIPFGLALRVMSGA